METSTIATRRSPHPLVWVAAIALIVFCGAGVAALMGWIPTSLGKPDDMAVTQLVTPTPSPAPAQARPQSQAGPFDAERERNERARERARDERANARDERANDRANERADARADARAARPAVVQPKVVAAACSECGVVQSVQAVQAKGEGSGIGAAGGAVVGGVLGNQVGGGSGKTIMTVVGAVGGAVAGNEIEKRVKAGTSYEISVRFDDGSSRVITQSSAPTWRAGDKVKVINGVIQSNG